MGRGCWLGTLSENFRRVEEYRVVFDDFVARSEFVG